MSPTYSSAHLRRQREAHIRSDGYGRHRHLYLHDTIRQLAAVLQQTKNSADVTWLDYGCGKGSFIDQIRPLQLFATIAGHDPAVEEFGVRPDTRYDLVTCLDVLDVVEPRFVAAVLNDIAAFSGGLAVFDCLTRPKPGSLLRPHPAFYWSYLISQHLTVQETKVEFPGTEGFERAVIIAAPRDSV